MAPLPPSSPPPSPPSASNSENSATRPVVHTPPKPKVDVATNNGVFDVIENKPDIVNSFEDFDRAEDIEKYKKYEADYVRRLNAKYFSKKNLYGGNIFDEKLTIDDEIIKSSRWPCTQSYADPVQGFEDQSSSGSTSTAETPTNISNGKYPSKKSG